jgi:hypothetical protein
MVDYAADNGITRATRLTTPAQQGRQCHSMRDKSRHQVDKDDNTDEVVDTAVECGYNI